jgi:hypothetical protein
MGWLSRLLGRADESDRFFSRTDHEANRARQMEWCPLTLGKLREYGVTPQAHLRLEYFFYTDTDAKAAALERALVALGYSSERTAVDGARFSVTGWSSPMLMHEPVVGDWVDRMCHLGYQHDAEFDGWGTNPQQ